MSRGQTGHLVKKLAPRVKDSSRTETISATSTFDGTLCSRTPNSILWHVTFRPLRQLGRACAEAIHGSLSMPDIVTTSFLSAQVSRVLDLVCHRNRT